MSHPHGISPSKIAASIGASVRTLQRLARAGDVPDVDRSGYHFVYRDTPALKAWIRKRRNSGRRGNRKGVPTRRSYAPNLWRTVQKSLPDSLAFLDWLEANYLKLPWPKRPLEAYTADDWRSLPLPALRRDVATLARGAQSVRVAAKIARKLIELGVFDPRKQT